MFTCFAIDGVFNRKMARGEHWPLHLAQVHGFTACFSCRNSCFCWSHYLPSPHRGLYSGGVIIAHRSIWGHIKTYGSIQEHMNEYEHIWRPRDSKKTPWRPILDSKHRNELSHAWPGYVTTAWSIWNPPNAAQTGSYGIIWAYGGI